MGWLKPDGRCWSGGCQNQGAVKIGTDADGNECRVCEPCFERMNRSLMQAAQRYAMEVFMPVGKPN
jgi:hypothetical protein